MSDEKTSDESGQQGVKKSFYIKPGKIFDLLKAEAKKNRRSISEWLSMILEERYKEELDDDEEKEKP